MSNLDNNIPVLPRPISPSFYKRPLPDSCISFSSELGKQYFSQALSQGGMDSYFSLASQFLTQNEPAFCGLGTLCMILNALEIDPRRKWKGPWRWYEQEMLDCCRPLNEVAKHGITLSEFVCLSRCNGLVSKKGGPTLNSTPEEDEKEYQKFKQDLLSSCHETSMIAISYSRKTLGQTGDGHFSPIGGYSQKDDMVLILDVARFKYPSYWISSRLAWESMKPLDKSTELPRGYVVMSPSIPTSTSAGSASESLVSLTLNKFNWATVSGDITQLLLQKNLTTSSLLDLVVFYIASQPIPFIATRSKPELAPQVSRLVAAINNTKLAKYCSSGADPLIPLLILALFSSTSSLAGLVPDSICEEFFGILRESGEQESIKKELEYLENQVAALRECCQVDSAKACGCAVKHS